MKTRLQFREAYSFCSALRLRKLRQWPQAPAVTASIAKQGTAHKTRFVLAFEDSFLIPRKFFADKKTFMSADFFWQCLSWPCFWQWRPDFVIYKSQSLMRIIYSHTLIFRFKSNSLSIPCSQNFRCSMHFDAVLTNNCALNKKIGHSVRSLRSPCPTFIHIFVFLFSDCIFRLW